MGQKGTSRHVLKAMGLFGGVQVATILCSVVRTKLIAIWIGAAGVGLFAIFNGALEMLTAISQVGIRSSAVRDLSTNRGSDRIGLIIRVVRRWAWVLGLIGGGATVAIAPLLSQWTFGNEQWRWAFMLLGVSVFLNCIGAAEGAIMQGLEQLKRLGRASMWGILAGFVVSVPMFYFWRINSVLPSILAYSVTVAGSLILMRDKPLKNPTTAIGLKETWNVGRSFLVLGVFMVASDIITQVVTYVFTAWLNLREGDQMVGFYRGGFTVVNRYVGLVFTAIAMEYYPRLAGAIGHNRRISTFVFHEMTLVLWILLPLVMVFICAAPLIVRILYTRDFLVIVSFISVAMAGTLLRGVSWCMSFVMLARGDGRTFLLTEFLSDMVMLGLNIGCFSLWGLDGLGVAYVIWYAIYTIMVWIVYKKYGYKTNQRVLMLSAGSLVVAAAQIFLPLWLTIPLAIASVGISYMALRQVAGNGKKKRLNPE